MDEKQNTVFVLSQIAVFNAVIAGMVAENMQRAAVGQSMAYVEDDFTRVIEASGIHHNAVLETLNAG